MKLMYLVTVHHCIAADSSLSEPSYNSDQINKLIAYFSKTCSKWIADVFKNLQP